MVKPRCQRCAKNRLQVSRKNAPSDNCSVGLEGERLSVLNAFTQDTGAFEWLKEHPLTARMKEGAKARLESYWLNTTRAVSKTLLL